MIDYESYIYLKEGKISTSKRTAYFAFILFAVTVFLVISSFQYINTADYARWPMGGWSNDMSRYWFGFQDAQGLSLRKFLLTQGQEPLYIAFIWIMRKLTSHFSLVLLVAYTFVFVSYLKFLRDFILFRCTPPLTRKPRVCRAAACVHDFFLFLPVLFVHSGVVLSLQNGACRCRVAVYIQILA